MLAREGVESRCAPFYGRQPNVNPDLESYTMVEGSFFGMLRSSLTMHGLGFSFGAPVFTLRGSGILVHSLAQLR